MTGADALDEASDVGVGRCTATAKVRVQLGIGQLQNLGKAPEFPGIERRPDRAQERLQDRVELAHAAAATPAQPTELRTHGGG